MGKATKSIATTLAIALGLALGAARPAMAADPAEVEELIRQGVELRQRGRDAAALPLFERAYRLAPVPRTAAQLGLAELALGYRLEAERHLGEALASPSDVWVQKYWKEISDSLSQVQAAIGAVAVVGSPDGAEVRVNGTEVGRLPLEHPIRVGEGSAIVELEAPGYIAASQPITVRGSSTRTIRIDLLPKPAERTLAGSAASGASAQPPQESAPPSGAIQVHERPGPPAAGSAAMAAVGAVDLDALLGVQFWLAGVVPEPEPSASVRVSAGLTAATWADGRIALRLGGAVAASLISESAGRVYFTSLLATPGLRATLGARISAWLDLGVGLLVVSGVRPGSVLVSSTASKVTGALSSPELHPSLGVGYALNHSATFLVALSGAWSRRPDPLFREGSLLRLEPSFGLALRF